MSIGDRIRQARERLGLSQEELAKKLGYKSRSSINKIELGIYDITQSKVVEFSKALNVTPSYLMGWDENSVYQYNNVESLPKMKKVPLLGTIACGEPILAEENIEMYLNMPEDIKGTFALRCKGDSMINARIFDGDIVYIREQPEVENGEIAAVLIDNEATLKRVYMYDNRIELRAENPTYKPINIEGDKLNEVKIIGKAVGFFSVVI